MGINKKNGGYEHMRNEIVRLGNTDYRIVKTLLFNRALMLETLDKKTMVIIPNNQRNSVIKKVR